MRQLESFFWGIVAALGSLILQLFLFIAFSFLVEPGTFDFSLATISSIPLLILANSAIEEAMKYLIIAKRIDLFSLSRSYIINALFVGSGFFATESFLIYHFSSSSPAPEMLWKVALIHLGSTGLIGYIIGTRNPRKVSTFLLAISVSTFFHGTYNFLILKENQFSHSALTSLIMALILINIFNLIRIPGKLAQD